MKYAESFSKMLDNLVSNDNIEVSDRDIRRPLKKLIVDISLGNSGIEISQKQKDFFQESNGVLIVWKLNLDKNLNIKKYREDDSIITGRIEIHELGKLLYFDEHMRAESWTNYLDDDEKKDLINFRHFDYNDDDIRSGFMVEEGIMTEEMVFLERGTEGFCPVPFSFEEYINYMISFKGFQGWQQTLYYKNSSPKHFERMIFYLKQLFPEENFDKFN